MAGDLTIYGMRDNVKLIRTGQDNKQEIITMDLNKAETVLSPYYQDVYKRQRLPYVTPCGTFSRRNSKCFVASSHLVVVDIDHLDSYQAVSYTHLTTKAIM